MASHKHEWQFAGDINYEGAFCNIDGCKCVMMPDEIERRLRATECLNAENASCAAEWPAQVFDFDTQKALKAYARTLESKDDPASTTSS